MAPIVSQLVIYPIKSCRGISLPEAQLSRYGLEHDRVFLVINPETNVQRTCREHPRMVLIEPKIEGDQLAITAGGKTVRVPLHPNHDHTLNAEECTVKVFSHTLQSIDLGDEVAQLLTDYLGVPCRLVHKSPKQVRAVVEHCPGVGELGYVPETAFADTAPILILSEESVSDMNTRLDKPVTVARFRPNIIIKGVEKPWDEDMWCLIDIRGVTYYLTCRCTRCEALNVDPETGIKDPCEPQHSLQKIRRVDKGKRAKYTPCVGMNVVASARTGCLKVGDVVDVKQVFVGERMRTGARLWSTSEAELEALTAIA